VSNRLAGTLRLAGWRVLGAVIVVWGVVTLTFILARVVSPDPTNLFVQPQSDAATRAAVRHSLGLDQPLWSQYGIFLADLVRGNLATSFVTKQPVSTDLGSRLPATLELAVYAVILGTVLGVATGVIAAVRRGKLFDHVIRLLTVSGLALPPFFVGLMLLYFLFVRMHIAPGPIGRLPVGVVPPPRITGFYVIDAVLSGQLALARVAAQALALPVITLAFAVYAPIARTVRAAMTEALDADYVRTAVAMGIGKGRIYFAYAFKNALLPVITMLAGAIGFAFSGAVLVEGIFAWPGIGQYALNAIQQSDFPAIQGFVLYCAVLYVVIYLVLDLVYLRIDPRVRT
jgi:ABC-type dipeptide/oligopeptide/nickel transport system permease component